MTNLNFKEVFLQPVLSRKDSEADAFCIKDITYSYRQLYNLTEQIYLLVKDIQEVNIGLYAVDDIRTYASIIALWA